MALLHKFTRVINSCGTRKIVNHVWRPFSSFEDPLDPSEVTEILLEGKRRTGVKYGDMAQKLERNKVWLAAALMGQHPMDSKEADQVLVALGLAKHPRRDDLKRIMIEIPNRGNNLEIPPTDPTVYRLQEIVQVYGAAIKALIHEEFGDGIMSAVDLEIDLQKEVRGSEERVVITLNGKFLKYKKW